MKELLFDWDKHERRQVDELWTPDEIYDDATEEILIRFKEDYRLERKSAGIHADSLATYFSMWANTAPLGGLIILGIEDDGEITGCSKVTDSLVEIERRIKNDLVPDAKFVSKRVLAHRRDGTADYLLLFRVQYCEDKVVETNKGEAFVRSSNSRKQLEGPERHELEIEKGQKPFELEPSGLKYPDEFNMPAIRAWADNVRKNKGILANGEEPHQVLIRHKLGKIVRGDFAPNIACALLFANSPQDVVPGSMVRFQRIEGIHAATGKNRNVVRDMTITGTIPEIISQTVDAIESQIRTYSRLGDDGKFYAAPEYPMEAWHEAVVNACVHRSYSLRGMNIFVRMFNDRIEVESPGPFPALVTPETIYEVHHRRNWWLMGAMFFLDMVKCENEGAKRIRDSMKDMQLPPPLFQQKDSGSATVRVTLRNNQDARQEWIDADISTIVGPELAATLSDLQRRILNFVAEHKRIKITQAQNLMPKPRFGTARDSLNDLVEMKLLVHVSRFPRDSTAYYEFPPQPATLS